MQTLAAMDKEKKLSYIPAAIFGYLLLETILRIISKEYHQAFVAIIGVIASAGWLYSEYKLIWRV